MSKIIRLFVFSNLYNFHSETYLSDEINYIQQLYKVNDAYFIYKHNKVYISIFSTTDLNNFITQYLNVPILVLTFVNNPLLRKSQFRIQNTSQIPDVDVYLSLIHI